MKPKIIKTDEEHEAALAHVESLMDAEPDSPAEEELELWALLVEQYEKEHFPIDDPDPIEAIRFRMDQLGLRQRDLVDYIGPKSKVSEVLNRKRPLSLPMIRDLHLHLGISAATLIRETQTSLQSPGKIRSVNVSAHRGARGKRLQTTKSPKKRVVRS
jgi:HTH-type transcriptional regulator/antitoxin HigA